LRIINVRQQTEEWEHWRNRPTASEFAKFITPVRGDYSSQATAYAAKIVAKRLGVYTEPPPNWAMERGSELEPSAKIAYTKATGRQIQDVGFVLPDETDAYGGSPDGLVNEDGLIEVKSPLAETLISYHAAEVLPLIYKPQVQGLLFITGRAWCDFWAFHPELNPFLLRVEPDLAYHAKIADSLLKLLREIKRLESKVETMRHELVFEGATQDNVRF